MSRRAAGASRAKTKTHSPARPRPATLRLPQGLAAQARFVMPGLAALLLVASAALRGLYFRSDQLYIGAAVLVIAAVVMYLRERGDARRIEVSYLDAAVFGLLLIAWLAILWAAEPRLALQQAIVYTVAALFYLYGRSRGEGTAVPALIWGLGGIVAASWLMGGGVWPYPAVVTVVDRLSGPFQYPDAAGSLYFAAWLASVMGERAASHAGTRRALGALGGLSAYLFAATLSRGVWLIAPLGAVVLLGSTPKGHRMGTVFELTIVGGIAFGLAAKTFPHLHNAPSHYILLFGAVAAATGFAAQEFVRWLHARELDNLRIAAAALALVLVLVGGFAALRSRGGVSLRGNPVTVGLSLPRGTDRLVLRVSGTGTAKAQVVSLDRFGTETTILKETLSADTADWTVHVPASSDGTRLLVQGTAALQLTALQVNGKPASLLLAKAVPQSIYHRLIGISGTNLSVWERLAFWRDGLAMFAARPVAGWGGYAWRAIYQGFQSFAYVSSEAHSSLVDTAVSYGLLGVACVVLLALGLLYSLRRTWGEGSWAAVGVVAGAALWLHSLIDFDLSIAAMLLVLYTALGVMPQVRLLTLRAPAGGLVRWAGAAAGLLAVWALVLSVAAGTEAARGTPPLAQLKQAVALDPLSAQLHAQIAQRELASSGGHSAAGIATALASEAAAYRLDPYSQSIATSYAQMQIDEGHPSAGLRTLAVAQRDDKLNPLNYQNYEYVATKLATRDLLTGQRAAAKADLKAAWAMYRALQHSAAVAAARGPKDLGMPPPSAAFDLYAGEAGALLGHTRDAIAELEAASRRGQQTAKLWLAALGQVKGVPAAQYSVQTLLLARAR